jgi:hypothetical protein
MSLSFRDYLATRHVRYSPTSNFLRTLLSDDEFTGITSRQELDHYLSRRNIDANGRIHAHTVWKSYLVAKKRERRLSTAST